MSNDQKVPWLSPPINESKPITQYKSVETESFSPKDPTWVHSDNVTPRQSIRDEENLITEDSNEDTQKAGNLPVPPSAKKKLQYKAPGKKAVTSESVVVEDGSCCPMDPTLLYFRLFHVIVGILALGCGVANFYALFIVVSIRGLIIHAYAILFCVILLSVELEIPFVMHRFKVMDTWVFRGLFCLFVGVMTCDEGGEDRAYQLFSLQNIAGFALCVAACLYMGMGALCLRAVESRKYAQYRQGYVEIVNEDAFSPVKS